MRRQTIRDVSMVLTLTIVFALLLTACGAAATATPAPTQAPAATAVATEAPTSAAAPAVTEAPTQAPTQAAAATAVPKSVNVAMSIPTTISLTWAIMAQVWEAKAKEMGATYTIVNADNDVNRQASQVEDLIAKKVQAMTIAPIDAKAIVASIKKANAANIPVVTALRSADVGAAVAFDVRQDEWLGGALLAQYLGNLGKPIKILNLLGDLADINAIERRDAFLREIPKYPNIEVIATVPTKWDQALARDGVTNNLQAHPEMNAIFIPSDYFLPIVTSALEAAGKLAPVGDPKHIILVSIDGDPVAVDNVRKGYLDADLNQPYDAVAEKGAEATIQLAQGQQLLSPKGLLPGFLFTKADIDQYGDKIWGIKYASLQTSK